MIYKSGPDKVYVFEDVLSSLECKKYSKMINDIGYQEQPLRWEHRIKDVSKDKIVNTIKNFLNKKLNIKLKLSNAEIQNWHVNTESPLHVHNHKEKGRKNTIHNSLLYLNDEYKGGEFVTKHGIIIKPKRGMLTFFNGQKVYHGVRRVFENDRKTIIFWWSN